MYKASKRILNLTPSPTFALDAKVKELERKGEKIINLGIGEPDFETPPNVKKAGIHAIKSGFTHYTAASGKTELREEIARKLKKENGVSYKPSEIVAGSGSKTILYEIFQVLCEEGDEVIVPVPSWGSYIEQIMLSGATPILLNLKPPFKLTAEDLGKKITRRTKAVMINTPSNPTGAVIDRKELEKIAKIAIKYEIFIVVDEMYEKIVYQSSFTSLASLDIKSKEYIITVNGFSKTYAMTGWRLGYVAGPEKIMTDVSNLQSQLTANPSSIAQIAGIEAYRGTQKYVSDMVREFSQRRKLVLSKLSKIDKLDIIPPEGGFFFFVGVEKLLGSRYKTSAEWCKALLAEWKVAVVPGEAFFYPGYFRLSFAAKKSELKTAIERLEDFIVKN